MGETRRKFSREFKIEAFRLVTEGGQSIAETARELDFGLQCSSSGAIVEGNHATACRAGIAVGSRGR